jgi:predicted RNase H-like HicB family nuclease
MDYNIQIYRGEKYFIGICEEIPGAMTQGETVEEVKENMKDAIKLIWNDIFESMVVFFWKKVVNIQNGLITEITKDNTKTFRVHLCFPWLKRVNPDSHAIFS